MQNGPAKTWEVSATDVAGLAADDRREIQRREGVNFQEMLMGSDKGLGYPNRHSPEKYHFHLNRLAPA